MKFVAVICEYNPFHNGHKYQLDEIKRLSGCDKILCLMSGNFTQRGEATVFGKYTRARHAIENGADVVLELPAAFAVAPAELFARGGVHILSSIPAVDTLAFGCENGDKESFLALGRALNSEDKQFKAALKENMKDGTSYIRARNAALLALNTDIDEALLTSPNNILGAEYCHALLAEKSKIQPLPIPRVGGGYADTSLYRDFSSASALRSVLGENSRRAQKALKRNLPASAFADCKAFTPTPYRKAALFALLNATDEKVAATTDCAEGLENRLRTMIRNNPDYEEALKKVVSKRYTLSRVKRILAQNFLGIRGKDARSYAQAALYLNVLAVKKESAEEIFAALAESSFPLIARKGDFTLLKKEALACFMTDVHANDLYNALTGTYESEFLTLFV